MAGGAPWTFELQEAAKECRVNSLRGLGGAIFLAFGFAPLFLSARQSLVQSRLRCLDFVFVSFDHRENQFHARVPYAQFPFVHLVVLPFYQP